MKTNNQIHRPGGLALTREILAVCGFSPGDRILDAGCGFGATVRLMQEETGLEGMGLDRAFSRLSAACEAGSLPMVAACLPCLPFRPETFKGIFCECVLSLVPDKQRCLKEFYSALAPGGRLIIADLVLPDLMLPALGQPEKMPQQKPHLQRHRQETVCRPEAAAESGLPATCMDGALTQSRLAAAIAQAGFDILEICDHTRLLKQMACEMVFEHGSLERFYKTLTGSDMDTAMAGRCRTRNLKCNYKFNYAVVTAVKQGR